MAEHLDVPCFRYHGRDLAAPLAAETQAGGEVLVRCPVRGGLYQLTPEERVRQALVWFLTAGSERAGSWRGRVRVAVEQRSVDVSGYYVGNGIGRDFAPIIPVVAMETKRREIETTEDQGVEDQLRTYMLRERCRSGLTFNSRQAAWVTLGGDVSGPVFTKMPLPDLLDVERRIDQAADAAEAHVREWAERFRAARAGDFSSCRALVDQFGDDPRLTFALSLRTCGTLESVQAFNLQARGGDTVAYFNRGLVTRKRPQFTRQEFHALLAIRPL